MLEIKNLTGGYDSKIVLQKINLKITFGELVGIIGPNGSGKTTLLRAITGLLKPIEGSVFLEEKNINQLKIKELAEKIAVVSQNSEISSMTVEEFVLLGRLPHFKNFQFLETKKDLEIAEKCMNLTETLKFKDKSMLEISGGERQLVLIAKALTQEPKLLLLDEPTSHLDITHQVKILDLVKRLNKEFGLTVMIVLHDLNLASEYCQRLVLFHKGKIYQTGKPEEILDYQIIEEVYQTTVVVVKNPVSSKPYILLVSEEEKKKNT